MTKVDYVAIIINVQLYYFNSHSMSHELSLIMDKFHWNNEWNLITMNNVTRHCFVEISNMQAFNVFRARI